MISVRKKDEMKQVLAYPDQKAPDDFYYVVRGNPNITIIPPGRVGKEYLKTFGHYHRHNQPEKYRVLAGKAIFVLQKPAKGNQKQIEAVISIHAQGGDEVVSPAGWGHFMANVGKTALVTSDDAPSDAKTSQNDYQTYRRLHGGAYYVIDEGGKPKLVANPYYQNLPHAQIK